MRIIFMGTSSFAIPIAEALYEKHRIVLVVTQPDRSGNHGKPGPIKAWALDKKLEIFQPENIKTDYRKITETEADLIITVAYGQIIGFEVLNHAVYPALNIHASLLPRYRGAAPIQRAVWEGEQKTGISVIEMTERMDAGPVVAQFETEIDADDTADILSKKLSEKAALEINPLLEKYVNGEILSQAQNEAEATYAPKLTASDEKIDFTRKAAAIVNQIRALSSRPGAFFSVQSMGEMRIKVFAGKVSVKHHQSACGTVIDVSTNSFSVACGGGTVIEITEVQPPGGKRMSVCAFLNGRGRKLILKGKEIGS